MADHNWFDGLLPVHGITFEMCFTQSSTPGFFHQPALTAWIRRLLQSPDNYDLYLTIDVPEQGRRRYQAGDLYRFSVLATGPAGERWLRQLAALLHHGVPDLQWDQPMPFRNNWRLERMLAWPLDKPLTLADDLPQFTMHMATAMLAVLRRQSLVSLRLVSPWRVLRAKAERGTLRGEMRYCRNNSHLQCASDSLWLIRIGDALRDLARRKGETPPDRSRTDNVPASADLFWVDASYRDVDGHSKPMGGLLGEIARINPACLSDEQLYMLIIGQLLGVGQRRAFGYGRYQLLDAESKPLIARSAAQSLLEQSMQADNLELACAVVMDGDHDIDVDDGSTPDNRPADADGKLMALAGQLRHGHYRPPPLNGFVHTDADGGMRPLAAPPVYDRVLQRAVHQLLAPLFDGIMDTGSYGFRAGRSRYQVRDLIQSLYRDGYRWVFESDIRSFFDTVAWPKLESRLCSLLGDDPVVPVMMDWMRQPVRWQGRLIDRSGGLPQGSPLSPVLANLMLDDFDHDLRDAGCQLIRFADDFVIVAKTRKQAEQGEAAARLALQDIGLTLNEEKTRIVPFSEGFRFLGFMFVDGLAVESAPRHSDDAGKPPPDSWLARATQVESTPDHALLLRGEQAVALAPYQDGNRMLIFCGEPALLFSRAGSLCMERDNELLYRVPWNQLDVVMLFGRHQITTPALHDAMRHHVPVHMATVSGKYLGCAASACGGSDMADAWLDQLRCFEDDSWAMHAARSVVEARIRHMIEALRRRGELNASVWRPQLESALRNLIRAGSRDELNGIEGAATKSYFAALKQLVPDRFGFRARRRRPPPDPFNALLSLGYSMLYAHVDALLRADGLLPLKGFYHRSHGNHAALASDLMEPFRHVVEREALNMLHGKRLTPEDFSTMDGGCRLTPAARRLYFGALSCALLKPLKARGGSQACSVLEHIHRQNLALKFSLAGKADHFQAWRMR